MDFDDIYDDNKPMYPNQLKSLQWEDISAGFVYPGLIDSKNKQREPEFVAMSEYALLSTTKDEKGNLYKKRGNDLPLITNHGEDLPDGKKGEGYFLYVDATKKPSKVADLTINGDLCPNSKIYVSAWIANAYYEKSNETSNYLDLSNYPNLNFVIMGVMTDANGKITSETPVATFTTGDIKPLLNDDKSLKNNQWQNIMFEFVTTNVEYDKYRLRIENNSVAYFGPGNDFAIDDIKIYMESRTEATLTQNRLCPAWSPDASDFNKSNVAILKSNVIDISSGDVPIYYSWFKKNNGSVEVEHLPLDNYINNTNGNYGIITVNKEWIDIVKKQLDADGDGILFFPDNDNSSAKIKVSEGKFIDVYASVDDYLRVNKYNTYNAAEKKVGYFFTVEGSGDDALLALHIVHKDSLFQQHEEYTSIVTPMNLPKYIAEFSAGDLSDSDKEKRALEALYNELKCGDRFQMTFLPYSSIMLKGTSSNYDFDFTQAVVKHLAEGQDYTFAVEAYYEGTDEDSKSVMMPYNCYADWLLVTNDEKKWEDAQKIIDWRGGGDEPILEGSSLETSQTGSVTSFKVDFSGPSHYIAIPDPTKAVDVDEDGDDDHTPCAIPVEIYLYNSIPATLADPNVSAAVEDENGRKWEYDRPKEICNEPIIVRIPNSLEGKDNFTLNLDIDYFDEYLFAEIAKYNEKENEKTQDKNLYPLNNIYLYDANGQPVATPIKFNITTTAKDANNQTLTLELLKKNDAVSISGGHNFKSGEKYHFAGHNEVNGVTITPPFQFDVYVVPDKVEWTGDEGTAWHNDANWNPAIIPMSHTNVVIPAETTNKPVLNLSENTFESGAYQWLKHDIVALTKDATTNVLSDDDDLSAVLNSCKYIYFEAGAQLANQHMLNYDRAFVDVPFTGTNFGKSTANYKIMSF
ncbi:MAG: hypothetical protein UH103_01010, partial [Paludibacteraceae bacterium]|nr:hypothetical protein [Paludibacteraceae bacterium]